MKTTSRMIFGCVATGLTLWSGLARESRASHPSLMLWGPLVTGQVATPENSSEEGRRQVLELLKRSRAAMQTGDLVSAENLLAQAEAKKIPFGLFHLGDTPEKVRQDLEKMRGASPTSLRSGNNVPANSLSAPKSDSSRQAEQMLRSARLALAVGDAAQAGSLIEQVRRMNLSYEFQDDSPDQVELLLRKHNDLKQREASSGRSESFLREQVGFYIQQADGLLRMGELDEAERLVDTASRIPVEFGLYENSPRKMKERIETTRRTSRAGTGLERLPPVSEGVVQAGAVGDLNKPVRGALYDAGNDSTRNMQVSGESSLTRNGGGVRPAMDLVIEGERALQARDQNTAMALFRQAETRRNELDPQTQIRLQGHMERLAQAPLPRPMNAGGGSPLLEQTSEEQKILARQVGDQLSRQEIQAKQISATDPRAAMEMLQSARMMVEGSGLDVKTREMLIRRVDREISELQAFLDSNRPQFELAERNRRVKEDIERDRMTKLEKQQKIAEMVEEFNQLMDEQRFAEAHVVARRANELAPEESITSQLLNQVRFVTRHVNNGQLASAKEAGFQDTLDSVDQAAIPFDDSNPFQFGDVNNWKMLTESRQARERQNQARRSQKDLEIEQRLKTPVSLRYQDVPLSKVLDDLGRLTQINIYSDPRGFAEEGVLSDMPISIDLGEDISLKSALNLILSPLHLSYVIKDEVLKITSEQLKDGEVFPEVYYVADLVAPIPNFMPNGQTGLSAAVGDAYQSSSTNPGMGFANAGVMDPVVNASSDGSVNPAVLAQIQNAPPGMGMIPRMGMGGPPSTGTPQPINFGGPGGMGGGAMADFESLIELITTTIQPDSWEENGGSGAIKEYANNLSLVISAKQEVHEEIQELLEQLRRLQDLQVTIEVRFITLNDNYFERIGVNFDWDLNDKTDRQFQIFGKPDPNALPNYNNFGTGIGPGRDVQDRDHGPSNTVGLTEPGTFSTDLDIPFRQGSFAAALPQFGNYAPGMGATLGFAILSDLEAYFFLEASQGDRRSNVLQAPKVTLFNGQFGTVTDQTQSPFVISLIPVVGDFAIGLQPVIVVLNEGTSLSVQAVVSSDQRFVRVTVLPNFSQIGRVDTFTFQGSTTTTEDSESDGPTDDTTKRKNNKTTSSQGTTVQLPSLSIVNVSTTVSVPDGGTVLLGGIKRLREGRNEFGVPGLSKLPYVNRLFRNVGIGRETQSLMMMVTPRIIIQEEEERNLGISTP